MANERARYLRRNQTIGEERLWRELRSLRHQGFHFRRQVLIDHLIVDFACFTQRLVIEVDGTQHDTFGGRRADAARDAHLDWRGFRTLRFTNGEIDETIEGVMLEIFEALGMMRKPSTSDQPPTPDPSPQGGGEKSRDPVNDAAFNSTSRSRKEWARLGAIDDVVVTSYREDERR